MMHRLQNINYGGIVDLCTYPPDLSALLHTHIEAGTLGDKAVNQVLRFSSCGGMRMHCTICTTFCMGLKLFRMVY